MVQVLEKFLHTLCLAISFSEQEDNDEFTKPLCQLLMLHVISNVRRTSETFLDNSHQWHRFLSPKMVVPDYLRLALTLALIPFLHVSQSNYLALFLVV